MRLQGILDALGISIRNTSGTFKSSFVSLATTDRTITLPNKSFTVAGLDDLLDPAKSFTNIHSAGNLIANGFCETGTNYNFSNFRVDNIYVSEGISSSYELLNLIDFQQINITDTYFLVDGNRQLKITLDFISGDALGNNFCTKACYFFIACYDTDNILIQPYAYDTYSGSALTTLAQTLNPGDTSFYLTSTSGWNNASTDYINNIRYWPYIPSLGVYGYQEATGKVNKPYTYSQKCTLFTGVPGQYPLWLAGGINTSTGEVTLNTSKYPSGWTHETLQAGTPIMQSGAGAAGLDYFYTNIPSIGSNAITATKTVPKGTVKVKLGGIFNYGSGGTNGQVRVGKLYVTYL